MVHEFEVIFAQGERALAEGDAHSAYRHWSRCLGCLTGNLFDLRKLANAFRSIGHITEASSLITQALQQNPQQPELVADQASLLLDIGEAGQAVESFNQLATEARHLGHIEQGLNFLSNALMCMEYAASVPNQEKREAAVRWGNEAFRWSQAMAAQHTISEWVAKPDPHQPLRVGFISGDLCDHPVGFLLRPLLQHRLKDHWQTFIYDNGSRIDNTHRQLRAAVDPAHWRTIYHQDDVESMRTILADQLDVLVDLSGHTGRNRLRLMAHRLAGHQLSWLGYSGTTGLPTLDGILLDEVLSQGAKNQFAETIYTLNPSRFCFRPPFSPPLQAPPCIERGYITFGSFNNTAKYNPLLLAVWANLLKALPQSRLILKWRTFADSHFCKKIHQNFAEHGIDPQRVSLRGFSTHRAMLDEYNDVDVALDTFPFNGGFTSLESLWMGLPLITLRGNSPIERQSASFLSALDLSAWIADNTDHYVQNAITVASNTTDLIRYREGLRFQIMGSALYDVHAFSVNFSSVLDQIIDKI